MRIHLKNFRCYENETFDFGEEGIALLSGPSGQGKCLGKDTPILMYDGTIKMVQYICVGDILMGDDSTPRTVLSTCQGQDLMYEIIPLKGDSYVVNSQHILTLKSEKPNIKFNLNKNKWNVKYYNYKDGHIHSKYFEQVNQAKVFMNTISIEPYDISIQEYLKLPLSSQQFNYTFHMGVEFKQRQLEFDPYWLGLWLGNSFSHDIEITVIEQDMLNYLEEWCVKNGFLMKYEGNYKYRIIEHERKGQNRIIHLLQRYNLLDNKHIPHAHKICSRTQRLSLLAGLIDSDSHIVDNKINIIQRSEILSDDIKFLALSLGFMAIKTKLGKTYKYPIEEQYPPNSTLYSENNYYLICIYGDSIDEIPVLVSSKKILHQKKQLKGATNHKFRIEPQGMGEYFGFELDGNGRFLLGDFKVTHNSSILMGIHFALFGSGTKVTSYGKNSCMVELEFDGMKIVRTKRPNRVVVNDIYEDDSAQEIINKKFGDTFDVTAYISQNALNSFILMSPIEKLSFLEKFAFRDVDLGKIKGRCKANISKRHDELLGIVSQLEMAKDILEKMNPPDEVKFPLKCKKINREKEIKNEIIRFKNSNTLIRRSDKKIKAIMNEINDLKVLEATLQSRNETYLSLTNKLKELETEVTEHTYIGDEDLDNYENMLQIILSRREINSLEKQLENDKNKLKEMKEYEEKSIKEELEKIKETIWKEYTVDELHETIKDMKLCLDDLEKVVKLKKEIKSYTIDVDIHNEHKSTLEKYIEDLDIKQKLNDKLMLQQFMYSCPKCTTKLRLLDNNLIIADDFTEGELKTDLDTVKKEIQRLECDISKLRRTIRVEENKIERTVEIQTEINNIIMSYETIPDIEGVREDLEYLYEYQKRQFELVKRMKKLENSINSGQLSGSYIAFKKNIEKLKEKVKDLNSQINTEDIINMNEEEIRQKIIEQSRIRDRIMELKERLKKIKYEQEYCKKIIDNTKKNHISKYGDVNDKDNLEKTMEQEQRKIEEQQQKRTIHEENIKQIESWKIYQEELDNYQIWIDKVDNLNKLEKEARNQYASATQLKDKILEAESIAMLNIIDSINTHARVYLDYFFVEHPISVNLQPFKQTKNSTKPKINIAIEYKGMEAELNMLSGGEISRVILAYTLALAEMFNAPLLLLDECTSSLDQELTGLVFDAIRENFNGKMTLIIAHQVVTGTFDKVIILGGDKKE